MRKRNTVSFKSLIFFFIITKISNKTVSTLNFIFWNLFRQLNVVRLFNLKKLVFSRKKNFDLPSAQVTEASHRQRIDRVLRTSPPTGKSLRRLRPVFERRYKTDLGFPCSWNSTLVSWFFWSSPAELRLGIYKNKSSFSFIKTKHTDTTLVHLWAPPWSWI